MRVAAAIFLTFVLSLSGVSAMAEGLLPRAASVSVCTDQYLLALAEPRQVAAVSWQARTARSPVAARAQGLPQVRGFAEELLALEADLVLFDPYGHPETARRLGGLGRRVLRLGDAISAQDVEGEVLRVARALGREGEGARVAGELAARRQTLIEFAPTQDAPLALYVSPGGGGAGAATYVDEVLSLAGYRNLQAELGYQGWQRIPLEDLVANPPDVVVTSFFATSDPSLLDGFTRHPLFRRMIRDTPVIDVPAAMWVCAGPFMLNAAEHLAGERERLFPAPVEVARP